MYYLKKIKILGLLVIFFLNSCNKDDDDINNNNLHEFSVNHESINTSFVGANDGSITLTVNGNTGPYTYNWSSGDSIKDIHNLFGGNYTYSVTDNRNKTISDTVVILEFPVYKLANIQTDYGDILIWLHYVTPLHMHNFIKLTNEGFYDNLIFHRVIDNFVIQGGDPTGTGSGGPGYTIAAEFIDSLKHDYGAVGTARLGNDINPEKRSSGSQFYIVERSTGVHNLDTDYTVFGLVINGMDAVGSIAEVAVDTFNKPIQPVYMKDVEIISYTADELLTNYGFEVPK